MGFFRITCLLLSRTSLSSPIRSLSRQKRRKKCILAVTRSKAIMATLITISQKWKIRAFAICTAVLVAVIVTIMLPGRDEINIKQNTDLSARQYEALVLLLLFHLAQRQNYRRNIHLPSGKLVTTDLSEIDVNIVAQRCTNLRTLVQLMIKKGQTYESLVPPLVQYCWRHFRMKQVVLLSCIVVIFIECFVTKALLEQISHYAPTMGQETRRSTACVH